MVKILDFPKPTRVVKNNKIAQIEYLRQSLLELDRVLQQAQKLKEKLMEDLKDEERKENEGL